MSPVLPQSAGLFNDKHGDELKKKGGANEEEKKSFNESLGENQGVRTEVTRHTNHSTRGERRGAAADPPRAQERGAQEASGALRHLLLLLSHLL